MKFTEKQKDALKAQLIALGQDRLSDLIIKEAENNSEFKKNIKMILDSSPKKISNTLLSQIKAIARAERFIDWRESFDFSDALMQILSNIENYLLPTSPEHAIALIDTFLAMDEQVFNRCDDSNGNIGDQFRNAVILWGKAWGCLAEFDGEKLATAIWNHLQNNDYGIKDNIISACAAPLKQAGLETLEKLAKDYLLHQEDDFSAYHVLHDTALIRQSPEAFKEVFKLAGRQETDSDKIEMARMLIKAWRAKEAIELLESINDSNLSAYQMLDLLIEAYDIEGDYEKCQQLRWNGFIIQSNAKYYHAYTKYLSQDSQKEKALNDATEFANNHICLITGIKLLNELGLPDQSSALLLKKYDRLDGDQYYDLKDIAKYFAKVGYPLEAILIYRRLTESIVNRAQSKYYQYAFNYLGKSLALDKEVTHWLNYPNTPTFISQLKATHSRKPSFMQGLKLIEKS